MHSLRRFVPPIVALAALTAALPAQASEHVFVGARVHTVAGPPIDDAVLLVRDGKIAGIGGRDQIAIPPTATVHDLTDKVVIPGLVCTHSHVGGPAGADRSAPIQPECRVYDSLDVRDPGFRKARAGGLTTLNIMPGSGHLLSGQTIYVKLRAAGTIDELCYQFEDGSPMGGMKMANGTNSMRQPPFPGTRGKSAALMRAILVKAQRYAEKVQAAGDDPTRLPERDLGLEALGEVLDGTRIVHHHTHRHDDILTVLRMSQEFGFRVVLHHVSDGWKVADEIAAADVGCSLTLVDAPGGKLEAMDARFETGGILDRAGVKVAFNTDDGITDSRVFLRMAALAVRGGMSREAALRALTLSGAEMLDLDERVGSIEDGKDADLAILSGDPFSVWTRVEQTWVEGQKVFDLANPDDALYAEGGPGASQGQVFQMCCFQDWGNAK